MAETYKDVECERDKLRIELAEMTEYGRVTRSTLDKANKRIAELERELKNIIVTYAAYRDRGVIPAPIEWANVVAAIAAARKEGK